MAMGRLDPDCATAGRRTTNDVGQLQSPTNHHGDHWRSCHVTLLSVPLHCGHNKNILSLLYNHVKSSPKDRKKPKFVYKKSGTAQSTKNVVCAVPGHLRPSWDCEPLRARPCPASSFLGFLLAIAHELPAISCGEHSGFCGRDGRASQQTCCVAGGYSPPFWTPDGSLCCQSAGCFLGCVWCPRAPNSERRHAHPLSSVARQGSRRSCFFGSLRPAARRTIFIIIKQKTMSSK